MGELSEQGLAVIVRCAKGCCEVPQCILQLPCPALEPSWFSLDQHSPDIHMQVEPKEEFVQTAAELHLSAS